MGHLHGERITLREYRYEDLSYMREWVNDHEVTGTLYDNFLYPQTDTETESFLNAMVDGKTDRKGFIISLRDTLEYIGQIDLNAIDWRNRAASLGIVIGRKEYHGQGYGREAIGLLQQFVFDTLNLNRLHLDVYEFNQRAFRCYLSCGFVEEGRLRKRLFRDGRYWDVIQMSILKDEWEQQKSAEEREAAQ
ncbi:GNAT family N-acetyltransferase [Cohnella candidum]|uniref:N-acetyltransferase n=1 Tax=Cohnella candidum TaxID=2674991 RepID=A0A3G3JW44_9BACL|nr:GNAT family protein [Cohnella candidum]AYQ72071.1 N-acetyltransferase [Cohnella candidum]